MSGGLFRLNDPKVSNYVEILRSRSMAERVKQRLGDSLAFTAEDLQLMVTARPVRETDIIQLAVSAPTAGSAVAIADAYLDAYLQYDLDQSRTDVSAIRQFIEDQLTTVAGRLDSSEKDLERFKTSCRLADLDAETRTLIERQSDLAASHQQVTTEVQGMEAQLAHIQAQIGAEGDGFADRLEGISSPLVSSLKAALDGLEVEKTNLMLRGFGETSERVRALNRQIDSTRSRLRVEAQVLIRQQGFVDPVGRLGGLFESALALQTGLAAARARERSLAAALARHDSVLGRLPEAERVLARLTRDVGTGRRVHSLLSERYEEARIQEVGRIPSVRVVDRPQSAKRTRPNIPQSIILALVLAPSLSLGAVWTAEHLDNTVRGARDLDRLGLPVLGSIPLLVTPGRRWWQHDDVTAHLITHTDVASSGAEAFRMLRTGLAFASAERSLRTIVVTSPGPSEGKSTVAVNLASVLAQHGRRILLVDADLRHPVLHTVFRRGKKPGLSDVVLSNLDFRDAVFPAGLDGLFCLPCGTRPPSPADLLALPATEALFRRLADEYDFVIVDSAPALVAADSPILGARADTTLMVVRAGRTAPAAIEHAYAAMQAGGARVAGFVVNGVERAGRYGLYHYYRYRYTRDTAEPA
jgi:tyrosine-protein kinase Etk/Wzc